MDEIVLHLYIRACRQRQVGPINICLPDAVWEDYFQSFQMARINHTLEEKQMMNGFRHLNFIADPTRRLVLLC